jgi:hypothetical protein
MAALPQTRLERRPYVAPEVKELTRAEALRKLKRAANAGNRTARAMLPTVKDPTLVSPKAGETRVGHP